ncbi:MAG: 3'-5' exonuclease [Alcanivoracaceae bacterium]|nr:3'-5' exonuclease [Alcanivoracaceae bacterium]
MYRYAVIDFETNGLMPGQGGRALEVAAVIVEGDEIVASWQSLMNPGGRVPRFITALTGITPAMVRTAPSPDEVMTQVHEFVGDATLVAHNASFDRRFWEYELDLCGRLCSSEFLCTVLIGRRLYPWAPNHKLATLVELHRIPVEGQHHRALADAAMTAHLFMKMQRDLSELYPQEWQAEDFLARYQRTGKALVRSTAPH